MTPWTPIPTIPAELLDKKTASQAAGLNDRFAQLAGKRARHDADCAAFLANGDAPAEPGLYLLNARDVFLAERNDLLSEELVLRQDLATFLEGPRHDALRAAAAQAAAEYEESRAKILKQLGSIGFDVERDPWMGNLPERHPAVQQAREAARSARAHAADRNLINSNQTALDQVRAEIDQRRAAAVA